MAFARWVRMAYRLWIVLVMLLVILHVSAKTPEPELLWLAVVAIALPGAIYWAITERRPWLT